MADHGILGRRVGEALSARDAALAALHRAKVNGERSIDLSTKFTNQPHAFAEADARTVTVLGMVRKLPQIDDALHPQSMVAPLSDAVDTVRGHYQTIVDQMAVIEDQGGAGAINQETGVITARGGQAFHKLGNLSTQLWNTCDQALAAYYPLAFAVRPKGQLDLSPLLSSFKTLLKQAQEQHDKVEDLGADARIYHDRLAGFASEGQPLQEELSRLASEARKDRTTITEYTSEATQSITSIRATNEQAEQLKAAVAAYKTSFDSFQKQMSQREAALESGTTQQEQLFRDVEEIQSNIEKLNAQAEAMLSGATVAGLASSFGNLRDKLNIELEQSRRAFYFSIGFLFLSVLPLAVYVLPGLGKLVGMPELAGAHSATGPELAAQIAARALLLLPAAWLTKFAARRHAMLFKLKEHYAYKYSVASSVEGFKKQAEPYKDQIAAATFFELTFNPANRIDAPNEEERPPNPIIEQLLKRMTGGKE